MQALYCQQWENQYQKIRENVDSTGSYIRYVEVDTMATYVFWVPDLILRNALQDGCKKDAYIEGQISPNQGMSSPVNETCPHRCEYMHYLAQDRALS